MRHDNMILTFYIRFRMQRTIKMKKEKKISFHLFSITRSLGAPEKLNYRIPLEKCILSKSKFI